jgi:hypothetical protein
MISPHPLILTIRPLFYPPLKLILPKPPDAANFSATKIGGSAFGGKASLDSLALARDKRELPFPGPRRK